MIKILVVDDDIKLTQSVCAYALLEATGMNAKKNPQIGTLAENVLVAIEQERLINQDIHQLKGRVSSNIGLIIDGIINEEPEI